MRVNRFVIMALSLALVTAGAFAQAKPLVAVLSVDSPLYSSAAEGRSGTPLSAGDPLLVVGSQDKRLTVDGVPTLWYQVKTAGGATGWIPGSRLSFTSKAFRRSAFQNADQYASYFKMAARPGEKVVAVRSYEKVAKGDVGYFVATHDGDLPAAVAWERNLEATPDEDLLPASFPKALAPYVYFVEFAVIELAGEAATVPFATLAKTIPSKFPSSEGFYSEEPDEEFPWYLPPETTYEYSDYGYDDYGYGDEESGYDEDYVEGEESYGMIKIGSVVILGEHEDLNGGKDWDDKMSSFIGKQATVKELPGADSQGFLLVRVKENSYVWRVRNLTLKGRGEAGSYGYQVGDRVIIGAHRYIDEDNNWAEEMAEFVGEEATITSLEGTDGTGSFLVHVDIDDGDWYWRVETMSPAK
jgi:hypothetical protein